MSAQGHSRSAVSRSLAPVPSVLLTALLVLVTGCTVVSVDEEPQALDTAGWEEVLLGTTTTVTTIPEAAEDDTVSIQLFFIGLDDKPEAVVRSFPPDPGVNDVLAGLAGGPTDDEQAEFDNQLQSRLPTDLNPRFGERDGDGETVSIIVDEAADFRTLVEVEPERARLVATQIVCTMLNVPLAEAVNRVAIEDVDGLIPVLDVNGARLDRAAVLEDYNGCITGAQEREEAEAEAEADGENGEEDGATTTEP